MGEPSLIDAPVRFYRRRVPPSDVLDWTGPILHPERMSESLARVERLIDWWVRRALLTGGVPPSLLNAATPGGALPSWAPPGPLPERDRRRRLLDVTGGRFRLRERWPVVTSSPVVARYVPDPGADPEEALAADARWPVVTWEYRVTVVRRLGGDDP